MMPVRIRSGRYRSRKEVGSASAGGFTVVELIVVMTVIVLLLAIAIPGLNAISRESRQTAAVQTVNGALRSAYLTSRADNTLTAVRFLPGEWDYDPSAEQQRPTGRQHIVTYSYVWTSAADPDAPATIQFGEYFQRQGSSRSLQLPHDIWVAPSEALHTQAQVVPTYSGAQTFNNIGRDFVLDGRIGDFVVDASDVASGFYQADDFCVVFDPQGGLRRVISPQRLKAYIPPEPFGWERGIEADGIGPYLGRTPFQRYNFTGVTFYGREAFLSLGRDGGLGQDRQNWLRQNGRPFLVQRSGGGLVMGTQGQGTE